MSEDNNNNKRVIVIFISALMIAFAILILITKISMVYVSNDTLNVSLVSPLESNGGIPVNIQDQTSTPVDFFFTQVIGIPTTLAVNTSIDEYTINISSVSNCSVGNYLGMFNSDNVTDNRAYFGTILSITGTNVTLDTPIDFDFVSGDTVACFIRNLNVDGSIDNEIFSIQIGSAATQSIDITRIMISFITEDLVDLAKFGDIVDGLTNGLVLRRVDGNIHNIWNVKNNGEIANLCFDYDPYVASNPAQGQNGAKFRYTFSGQDKHGVAVRLNPGDELQLIIQDDLSTITQFRVIGEGHYVTD